MELSIDTSDLKYYFNFVFTEGSLKGEIGRGSFTLDGQPVEGSNSLVDFNLDFLDKTLILADSVLPETNALFADEDGNGLLEFAGLNFATSPFPDGDVLPDELVLAFTTDNGGEVIVGTSETIEPPVAQVNIVPNDPLFEKQWYLQNLGQTGGIVGADANVLPAWELIDPQYQQIRGDDIVIGIVDDGLEYIDPDLYPQFDSDLSYDFVKDRSIDDPSNTNLHIDFLWSPHGTPVAEVAAARGSNGKTGSGVAPNASLAGLRIDISGGNTNSQATYWREANALSYQSQAIDIYNL